MDDVMQLLLKIRSDAANNSAELATELKITNQDPPVAALMMCFNYATQAAELASHYTEAWKKASTIGLTPAQVTEKRGQNAERIVILGKSLFVFCMSAMEFQAKRADFVAPKVLHLDRSKRIFLRSVLLESRKRGLLPANDWKLWDGAIKIRNCLIHNNGVADEAGSWIFAPDCNVIFEPEKMSQGNILTFPRITEWMLGAYARWTKLYVPASQLL